MSILSLSHVGPLRKMKFCQHAEKQLLVKLYEGRESKTTKMSDSKPVCTYISTRFALISLFGEKRLKKSNIKENASKIFFISSNAPIFVIFVLGV